LHLRIGQGLPAAAEWRADVVARGQLGDDAAIFLVHGDLRMQGMRQQAALGVIQSEAGFVTGGFDAEN
jgi:hypothetical protein